MQKSQFTALFLRLSSIAVVTIAIVLGNRILPREARSQDRIQPNSPRMKVKMKTVEGEFDVKIVPVKTEDPQLGLMTLDKKYRGKLDAKGVGRMLTGMTAVPTSAAYVAMEKITGTLDGREGSFTIYHRGIMEGEQKQLEVGIVPDSGTNELKDIRGSMKIDIRDGKHFYTLKYHFNLSRK